MSDQTDNLEILLKPYGLSDDETRIYLSLLKKTCSTALSISRDLRIGRTKVYRVLDRLIEKELVVQKIDRVGLKFVANDPSQIEILLSKKESEIISLRNSLPQVLKSLNSIKTTNIPGSQIYYFSGKKGLSRVNWNLLKAENFFYSYEVATLNAYMLQTEAEKLRRQLVDNKIFAKTITNKKKQKAFTQVTEMVKNYWELRFLSEDVVKIKEDIFIYNNVYTVCNYLDTGDIFCFEIHNDNFAKLQKDIFDNLWNQAKGFKLLNEFGEAVVC